jgi:hypothetical protein
MCSDPIRPVLFCTHTTIPSPTLPSQYLPALLQATTPSHKGYRSKTPANAIRQNGLFPFHSKPPEPRDTHAENCYSKMRKCEGGENHSSSDVSVSVSLSDSTSPSVSLPSLESSSAPLRFLGAGTPPDFSVRICPAIVSAVIVSVL